MDYLLQNRARMAALGAASALAIYGLIQLNDAQILQDRPLLAAITLLGTFCTAVLLTCGPITLRASGIGGALLALIVTILMQICALRFATVAEMGSTGWSFVAGIVLTTIPLPFWIAHQRGQWRTYDLLFHEAWAIALRAGIATLFTGLVWLLIYLFDLLLSLVGVTVIASLLEFDLTPYLITGGLFGLGLAVVQELSDVIGPSLILRLLRLLVPITLFVVVIFLLAVPLNGFSNLFGGWSVGLTMLSIVAVGATLITAVVDQRDDIASSNRYLQRSARILAGLLVFVAMLGAYAIYLRAWQYGWTPVRVFAALIAVLALGYGVQYALASLRSQDWMVRIRQANINMALAALALAAISLTPILNAERISAQSQMARDLDEIDLDALKSWGVAGQEALAALKLRSKEPGQDALAGRLEGLNSETGEQLLPADLIPLLTVSPLGANVTGLLDQIMPYQIDEVAKACANEMPSGGKGCVLVVADFLPDHAGVEASLFYLVEGYLQVITLSANTDHLAADWRMLDGALPTGAQAEAVIKSLQASGPVLQPAPLWQLPLGNGQSMVFLNAPIY